MLKELTDRLPHAGERDQGFALLIKVAEHCCDSNSHGCWDCSLKDECKHLFDQFADNCQRKFLTSAQIIYSIKIFMDLLDHRNNFVLMRHFYTCKQAADKLGVPKRTLLFWRQTGKINAQRVGRTSRSPLLFSRQDIRAFKAMREVKEEKRLCYPK